MNSVSSPMPMSPLGKELTAEQKAEQELYKKDWQELTTEEKIERMRNQVKYNLSNLQRENADLRRKLSELCKHSHGVDGKILVPFNEYGSNSLVGSDMANSTRNFF